MLDIKKKIAIICFMLAWILLSQGRPDAQIPVVYEDSITMDEEGGRLYMPSFVMAEPVMKEIYVIDGRGRIIIYTSDLFPVHTISKGDGIESPQGLAVDEEGNVYVAQAETKDNPRHRISVFNASLKFERDIYLKGFEGAESFAPYYLAVDKKGNIYVAGLYFPGVLVLDRKGNLVDMISPEEEGKKVMLNNVSIDDMGRIYLVSEELSYIYVYDENRRFLFKFGEKGGSSGKLSRPKAVGVDTVRGRIYVVDYMRHTISAYDKEGKYLFEFGGMGWGEGWFQFPVHIAVDSKGRIMVADLFNHRIQVFSPR